MPGGLHTEVKIQHTSRGKKRIKYSGWNLLSYSFQLQRPVQYSELLHLWRVKLLCSWLRNQDTDTVQNIIIPVTGKS